MRVEKITLDRKEAESLYEFLAALEDENETGTIADLSEASEHARLIQDKLLQRIE